MNRKHKHTAKFHTEVSDEVVERGFGNEEPIHKKYQHKLDSTQSFLLKWTVGVDAYSGFTNASVKLVIGKRSTNQSPITKIVYNDIDNVPAVGREKAAEYFMKMAENF